MYKITVVEDDPFLRREIIASFEAKGYLVTGISSFSAVEKQILSRPPNLLVLDLNLPGQSGFELCKALKAKASFPILVLTARDALQDELNALGLGADDYLTKPCPPERLLARASRLLQVYEARHGLICCGRLSLDVDSGKLFTGNRFVLLPETEMKLLRLLMEKHPGVVRRAEIFLALWGGDD